MFEEKIEKIKKGINTGVNGIKKAIKFGFIGLVILSLFIAVYQLATTTQQEREIESAETRVEEGNYIRAIESYQDILEDWDSEDSEVTKEEIKQDKQAVIGKQTPIFEREVLQLVNDGEIEEAIKEITSFDNLLAGINVTEELDKSEEIKQEISSYINNKIDYETLEDSEELINTLEIVFGTTETVNNLYSQLNEKQKVIDEIGEKPENRPYDNSVWRVKTHLEGNLFDPDSLQFDGWSEVTLTEVRGRKAWKVRALYRAKNRLGGYVREDKWFYIINDTVVLTEDY